MIEEAILYCIMPNMWHSGKGKTMVTVKRSVMGTKEGCIGGSTEFLGQ